MAVATSKRTQTNFDVNAVWQYLTWKNVVCEAMDIGEYGKTCHARLSRLMMDGGVIFILRALRRRGFDDEVSQRQPRVRWCIFL